MDLSSFGIARAENGELTPAGEKFFEILRRVAKEAIKAKLPTRKQTHPAA